MDSEHISDLELLEYVAGRLDPARAEEVRVLLARRPADRRRAESLRRTWDVMGQWQPQISGRDVLSAVSERLARPGGRVLHVPWRWQAAGRVAAVWAVAIGMGVGGGWLSLRGRSPNPPPEQLQQDVSQALQLDTLGSAGSVGLAESLLDGPADEEVDR